MNVKCETKPFLNTCVKLCELCFPTGNIRFFEDYCHSGCNAM